MEEKKILPTIKHLYSTSWRKVSIRKNFFTGSHSTQHFFVSHPAKQNFPISTFPYLNRRTNSYISLHGCMIWKIKQKNFLKIFYTLCRKSIHEWFFFLVLFLDRVVSSQNFKPKHSWNQAKINQFWRWQQQQQHQKT